MPSVLAPPLVPVVDFLALDSPVEFIRMVVAEYENWIRCLLELFDELVLLWSIGEVAHRPQKFVAGVRPVEDARKLSVEFAYDGNITLALLRIVGVWGFHVLTRKVDELHTAVKSVDDLSGRHSVASVDELTPRDKVDVVHALVTRLDGCAVGDFQKPLTDFTTREIAVNIGADVQ